MLVTLRKPSTMTPTRAPSQGHWGREEGLALLRSNSFDGAFFLYTQARTNMQRKMSLCQLRMYGLSRRVVARGAITVRCFASAATARAYKLSDASLLCSSALINNQWVGADSGATFPVDDPATGATIGRVPAQGASETRRAVDAAHAAFASWRARPAK